jgi:hypothetical protein
MGEFALVGGDCWQLGCGKEVGMDYEKVWYEWELFKTYCNRNDINLESFDDYEMWWDCWKAGYSAAMKTNKKLGVWR